MHEIWFVHDAQAKWGPRRATLERAGWKVRSTRSATEALAWFAEGRPTLCLIDVLVEGLTGFDLCQRIRQTHSAESLPILMSCHVYQDPEHTAEAECVGAQAYLALPIEPEELLAHVTRLSERTGDIRAA